MELTAEQEEQHNQEMAEVAEATEAKAENDIKTDEEKLLAGKYKNVEELEKAYAELQSKLGQSKEETQEAQETTEEAAPSTEEAQQVVEDAGLNFDSMYDEYADNGSLSDATYESLAKAGISKEVVDNYIAGQEAINQTSINTIMSEVGGKDAYANMVEWASSTLTEAEQAAFNDSLNDENSARFAVQGLYARYKNANPNLIGGNRTSGASSNQQGYSTKTEMMTAINNPAYKVDATYRAEVQRKIAMSSFL